MAKDPYEFLRQRMTLPEAKQDSENRQEARSAAVRWLGLGRKPSGQVRDYLHRQGFAEDNVAHVIDELKNEGKIDDFRLARQKAKSRTGAKSESALRITQRLSAQGLDQAAIEQVLVDRPADSELALAALQGKFGRPKNLTSGSPEPGSAEQKNKYYRFLISRGFTPDSVREAVREFLKGLSNQDDYAD